MTPPREHLSPLITLPVPLARHWPQSGAPATVSAHRVYAQGSLALSYPLPGGLDVVPRSQARIVVRAAVVDAVPCRPDPQAWASRFLQAVVEVISSDRPLTQLVRWTSPRVYDDIQQRQQRALRHRGQLGNPRQSRHQVATVHVCQLGPEVAEVAARVTIGPRSRAMAARLDFERDRWTCTALTFG